MKSQQLNFAKLLICIVVFTSILTGCPQKQQYPPKLNQNSSPEQAIMYLSWHLRANRSQFNHITQVLRKYPQLKHFRHQTNQAVTQLIKAGMWPENGLNHQIHRQIGQSLAKLDVLSILKKDNSLIFHLGNATSKQISSTYNLVYNPQGLINRGQVSNNRKDREQCRPDYIQNQYPNKTFGSCYTQLTPMWYIHHAFQHE